MKLVLGLDLETTGLDTSSCEITEIGAVLWDYDAGVPVLIQNDLVKIKGPLPPEITQLTGITQEQLDLFGIPLAAALDNLCRIAEHARAIVAHNGNEFDRPILARAFSEFTGKSLMKPPPLDWIDTRTDPDYPPEFGSRKLTHLAAEYGFVNPFRHRAVFDVLTMLHVLDHFILDELVEQAASPLVKIIALVDYQNRLRASKAGYTWDPETKTLASPRGSWVKTLHACNLDKARAAAQDAGFTIRVV